MDHCVQQAQKCFQQGLRQWYTRASSTSSTNPCPQSVGHFACAQCSAAFPLQRFLAIHMARKHCIVSPVRHFVPQAVCISWMRSHDSVDAAQNHMRKAANCLERAVHLMPPMTLAEIQEVEREHKYRLTRQMERAVRHWASSGVWASCPYVCRTLRREHLTWIHDYLAAATEVGPTGLECEAVQNAAEADHSGDPHVHG